MQRQRPSRGDSGDNPYFVHDDQDHVIKVVRMIAGLPFAPKIATWIEGQEELLSSMIDYEFGMGGQERRDGFHRPWTAAGEHRMAVDICILHYQVATGCNQWPVRLHFAKHMVAAVIRVKGDEHLGRRPRPSRNMGYNLKIS
jgi:hypothetical protein